MAELEDAVQSNRRVALTRRGTEYVVVARRLRTWGRGDVFVGRLPMTGEELEFPIEEIESFAIVK